MPRIYTSEFRRKTLDLLAAGRRVADLAVELEISDQTIYNWRRQHLIDTGQVPGITSSDHVELVAARKRIGELEVELAATRRANELLKEVVPPKGRFEIVATMVSEGFPIQVACRVLDVAESSYYGWRSRTPSTRSLRHTWASEIIRQVHTESRGTYGARACTPRWCLVAS
jgi:putative transposase